MSLFSSSWPFSSLNDICCFAFEHVFNLVDAATKYMFLSVRVDVVVAVVRRAYSVYNEHLKALLLAADTIDGSADSSAKQNKSSEAKDGLRSEGGGERVANQLPFLNWGFSADDEIKPLNQAVVAHTGQLREKLDSDFLRTNQHFAINLYAATLLAYGNHSPRYLDGKKVLEVGCGRGGGALVLYALASPAEYTGMDFTDASLAVCREIHDREASKSNSQSIRRFVAGKAETLKELFQPDYFDVVLNVESSHCYRDFKSFAEGVFNALRPGGIMLWTDQRVDRHHSFVNLGTVEHCFTCFKDVGFLIQRVYDIRPNVVKAIQEGSLKIFQKMTEGGAGKVQHLLRQFFFWYSVQHRPRMLAMQRLDYHIVVLMKPQSASLCSS